MELTPLLDIAIGLTLVYLGASLFVTIANEYLSQLFNMRGKELAQNLSRLISDVDVRKKLAKSPALQSFFDAQQRPLSYVDPKVLARLLVGGLAEGKATPMENARAGIATIQNESLRIQLTALARSVGDDIDGYVQQVSDWADRSLTMLGEAYKGRMRRWSLGIGIGIAVAFNLDTIGLARHLYQDREAREATSAAALALVENMSPETFQMCQNLDREERQNDERCAGLLSLQDDLRHGDGAFGKLPIGWPNRTGQSNAWRVMAGVFAPQAAYAAEADGPSESAGSRIDFTVTILGWLLTGLAISLGASFWFDLLDRLVGVRYGMKRREADAKA